MNTRSTTDMIDRYLDAVRRNLPARLQSDVVSELADDLQSQVEDRESAIGRPLTLEEEGQLLRAYGNPVIVASRYQPHQYLIGPAYFPFYVQTLKVVLGVVIGLNFVAAIVDAVLGSRHIGPLASWAMFWSTAFASLGIVTLIFALIERAPKPANLANWDPSKLPAPQAGNIPRLRTAFDLLFNLIAAVWALFSPVRDALWTVTVTPNSATPIPFALGQGVSNVLLVVGIVAAGIVLLDVALLVRPDWHRLRAVVFAVLNVGMAIALYRISLGPARYVTLSDLAHAPVDLTAAARTLDAMFYAAIVVAICIALGAGLWNAWMAVRPRAGSKAVA
jgi:hypothetical protein